MASTKDVKRELSRRIDIVTQPRCLESQVRPYLRAEAGVNGDWQTRVVQLDGTGAATIEIGLGGHQRVFAKLYPDESGPLIYEKLKTLRACGFGPGERHQAVEPLGFIPEYGMLLTRAAEGLPVSAHIGSDEGAVLAGAKEAALWLAKLHSTPLRVGTPRALLDSGELLPLARRLAKTLCRRPEFLGLALEMIQALEDVAGDTVEGVLVQSHGQYRPIHVFVGNTSVTVIDLDRSRPCDPARDAAEFLHRLRMTTFWHMGSVAPADAPTRAFLAAYSSAIADGACLANLRFHWARYIFHSFNHKLKDTGSSDLEVDSLVQFYRSEFEHAINGRFRAS
jgi:Phosphotransferase enzyme family